MFLEVVLFLVGCLLVIKLYLLNKKPPGTPPGTNGLPLIGAFPPRGVTMEEYLCSCRKKYGDTFWLKIGQIKYVFLCDYEDIVTSFTNPALLGRVKFLTTGLYYKYGEKDPKLRECCPKDVLGIIFGEGDRWRNLRRFVIRRLRDCGMGRSSMEGIILSEAEALAEDFENYVGKATEVPWSVNASILNVVWRLVGDHRYDIFDEEIQLLCNNLNDVLALSQNSLFIFDMMPSLAAYTPNFILNYFGMKEFEQKVELVYKQMHNAIDEHKKTLDEQNPRDLIDSYLIDLKNHEINSPNKSEYGYTFSERELPRAIFDLFFAGSETTSSTIKWCILYMAKCPEVQKKLQDEIDSVVAKDRLLSLADKDKLPYLESCINETLRLKSILPYGLFHIATKDTKIGDYLIPKGTHVVANLIGCHKEPKFWENPTEFYPERFLNDDGTFNNKKKGFLPFSTGRRVCLGENLARMDLYFVLGTLMQRFTFTVPEGEVLSEEVSLDQPFVTLPKPFKIIINKRH